MGKDEEQRKDPAAAQPAPEVNTDFMKEEIRQHPVNRRKLARRTLITVIMAVLFGAVACLVFLVLEPVINNALNPTEEPAEVSFPEEIVEVEEEMSPEDMVADDQEFQTAAAEEIAANSVESITQEVLDEVTRQLEEGSVSAAEETEEEPDVSVIYDSLIDGLSELAETAQKSMVTVNAITSDYDWVGDAFSNTGSVSGLIIAERGDDLLILADDEGLTEAEQILITFHDDQQAQAQIECVDPITDLALLSVDQTDLSSPPDENENIAVCTLGSSTQSGLPGSMVMAAGSPTGTQGSVNYGIITNSDIALDIMDSAFRQITTDIYGSTKASGALFSDDGKVIGWIDMDHNGSDAPNLISAIGVTELKGLVENMSNGVSMGYLGIRGTDVPESISEERGIPEGAYVIRTEMDSPAMDAGIQAGDVITMLNGNAISSYDDVVDILTRTVSGRYLSVTVMRYAQDEYEEVDLTVQLTDRFEDMEE